MIAPLAALALAAWPAPGARVHVTVQGQFDNRAPFEVNLINAPPVGGPQEPPPLPITPEVVDALNKNVNEALDGVLTSLGYKVLRGEKELEKLQKGAKPLTGGTGDSRFTLALQIAGDNGLGGHHGGLDLRVTVHSLHRAKDIAGEGFSNAAIARTPDDALLGLRGGLLTAVTLAFNDLRGHLDDEVTRPRATLGLHFETAKLTKEQAPAAKGRALCAANLAEPLAITPLEGETGFDLEVRLKRVDPSETLAQFAKAYAGRLDVELGPNGKARCSTWHTALEGLEPVVTPGEREVRVRFEKPEPEP